MLEDDPSFTQADIFIQPPAGPECSDEDSGDEEQSSVNNLTRRQLEAEAHLTVTRDCVERERIGVEDEADSIEPDDGARHDTEIVANTNTALDSANRVTMTEPVQVDGTPVPKRPKRKFVRASSTPDVDITAALQLQEDDANEDGPAAAVKSRRAEKSNKKVDKERHFGRKIWTRTDRSKPLCACRQYTMCTF